MRKAKGNPSAIFVMGGFDRWIRFGVRSSHERHPRGILIRHSMRRPSFTPMIQERAKRKLSDDWVRNDYLDWTVD
jgi:hypothetical protein